MAEPIQAAARTGRGAHPSADRELSRLIFAGVRDALARYSLSAADRDDLTQKAVETAFARWESYRGHGDALRAWLRGIVRNEFRHFMRTRRRREQYEGEFAVLSVAHEAENPEEAVCTRDLFDHLIVQVPIEQRRILILVKLAEHTIREAASREGISHSTAHARYQAGMKAFTEAAERWREEQKQRGVAPLPLSIDEMFAEARPAPGPDVEFELEFERVWQRMATKLGLDDQAPPESGPRTRDAGDDEPPSSGSHNRDSPSLTTKKIRLLRDVGIFTVLGGGVLGGMIAGVALSRCGTEHARDVHSAIANPPSVTVAIGTSASPNAAVEAPRSTTAEIARSVDIPAPPPASSAIPRVSANHDHRRLRDELALLDRARSALEGGSVADALEALAEHARRFPTGQGAAERERLKSNVCARGRESGGAAVAARCAVQR